MLSFTGLGALAVNLACAFVLARYRHRSGSLTKAAFLSARNDALANVAIIGAGLITIAARSAWPDIIAGLELRPHPEGGHYRETFRDGCTDAHGRAASTAIYFLLARGERSHWHRIDAAEVWHFYAGAPLTLQIANDGCAPHTVTLGPDIAAGQRPQATLWRDGVPMGLGYSIGRDTTAFGVSGDGTVVVGDISLNVLPLSEGFVWTQGTGMMTIDDYLAFHGVLVPPGWELWHLTCVSADGNTIGGWGLAPDGSLQGFVATVPSPATAVPALICGIGSLLSRRRRV